MNKVYGVVSNRVLISVYSGLPRTMGIFFGYSLEHFVVYVKTLGFYLIKYGFWEEHCLLCWAALDKLVYMKNYFKTIF